MTDDLADVMVDEINRSGMNQSHMMLMEEYDTDEGSELWAIEYNRLMGGGR